MSVINKMLKELDQRQAPPPAGGPALRPLRAAGRAGGRGKEAFWRLLAILMLAGVVWIFVMVFQLQVQPVATNLAIKAAEDARSRPALPTRSDAGGNLSAPEPGPLPLANPEFLKLAPSIQTRIPADTASRSTAARALAIPPSAGQLPRATAQAETLQASPAQPGSADGRANPGKVEKRDRPRMPRELAEAEFRRGAGLLNEGRINDAKEAFSAALDADRTHESARQALVALLLDQRQIDSARRLLEEGLAINPGNAVFAMSLARILIDVKDYAGALHTLQGASVAGASNAEFQALSGAAYQRSGNHPEAMNAYQAALRTAPGSGASWIGLGISLEALDHPFEAAEAFRRSIATGTLSADLRAFAETRLRRGN